MDGTLAADYVQWDGTNWSRVFPFWLSHTKLSLSNSLVLEIGGGNGKLALWFAKQGAHVLCTDRKFESQEEHPNIEYRLLDVLEMRDKDRFDIVVFKSVLGAIRSRDDQHRAIKNIHAALRPGAELWFAENLEASPLHKYGRSKCVKWASNWNYLTCEVMADFFSDWSDYEYTSAGVVGAFGLTETHRRLLGCLDRWLDWLVPSRWRYILMGVVTK